MERDEDRTLARLKAHRKELVEPLVAEHQGHVVKLLGDGILVEFASVVDAVRCAVLIQQGMAEREVTVPEDQRLRFRIGINLGDVVREADGDLYGDGVNVAARLEQIAEAGGIVVSGTAYDHLQGKLGGSFESLGERRLKGIERPVRAYRVEPSAGTAATPAPTPPDKPSIAVLPFDNLSDDPAQTYFSDGIAEDLITELSRFRDLLVIARNSSFAFKGKPVDAVEAGRRLGVRFLLEGSVRKAGERVRITAQLIDAATGAHLWAERYDRTLEDVFAVQDEVVATIAATLAGRIELAGAERARRKPTQDLLAYDCLLRGIEHLAGHGEDANAQAQAMFERAAGLDPGYALARAYLALTIYVDWAAERSAAPGLERALALAREAVALDGEDSRCQRILGEIALAAREFGGADFHSAHAVALNPNDAHAAAYRAYILTYLGRPEEAVDWIRKAIRLNPFHPGWYWNTLARALHAVGRHEEALAAYERIAAPRFFHLAYMAACHGHLGHGEEAGCYVERTLEAKAGFSSGAWLATLPFRREEDRRRLLEELCAAGLPA
jgi:adenylate cyclase